MTEAASLEPASLIGLTLPVAQARLAQGAGEPPRITETEPPFLAKGYTPQWGELRVVRARATVGEEGLTTWQLLVTRELVGETRAPAPPRGKR